MLRILAGVDGEIRRFIAAYVADEIDTPQSQAAQVIDVARQLEQAWPNGRAEPNSHSGFRSAL